MRRVALAEAHWDVNQKRLPLLSPKSLERRNRLRSGPIGLGQWFSKSAIEKAVGVALAICVGVVGQSCRAPARDPSGGQDLLITSATLIDGTGAPARAGTSILIKGGRIAAVFPDSLASQAGVRVIDATGKYVIPGLADMHVHFGLGAPLAPTAGDNEESLARELYYGVTTILQLGGTSGSTDSIRAMRRRRDAGTLTAPYIYGTGGHLTLQGTHPIYTIFPPAVREAADALATATPLSDPVNLDPLGIGMSFVRTEEAARKAVQERARGGMDAIKITVESGPTPFGNDHPMMTPQMIGAIVDEATRHGLRVLAHVTSRDELEAALRGGVAAAMHVTQDVPLPDTSLAEEMASSGLFMTPTLSLFAGSGDFDDPFLLATVSEEEIAALRDPSFMSNVGKRWTCCVGFDELLASVGMLNGRGVAMAVGTDTGNPYVFPGYSVHGEMALLVRAGLTPMEAIQAATVRGAEMIGADSAFGTIEAGKRADLLILGKNPLEDIANTRSLEVVISEGRVIDRTTLTRKVRVAAGLAAEAVNGKRLTSLEPQ